MDDKLTMYFRVHDAENPNWWWIDYGTEFVTDISQADVYSEDDLPAHAVRSCGGVRVFLPMSEQLLRNGACTLPLKEFAE